MDKKNKDRNMNVFAQLDENNSKKKEKKRKKKERNKNNQKKRKIEDEKKVEDSGDGMIINIVQDSQPIKEETNKTYLSVFGKDVRDSFLTIFSQIIFFF